MLICLLTMSHKAICLSLSFENPVVNSLVPQPSMITLEVLDP